MLRKLQLYPIIFIGFCLMWFLIGAVWSSWISLENHFNIFNWENRGRGLHLGLSIWSTIFFCFFFNDDIQKFIDSNPKKLFDKLWKSITLIYNRLLEKLK